MSVKSLNLADKVDFARATGSSIAQIAQLFGKGSGAWDIVEGSYNAIPFHTIVSQVLYGGGLSSIRDSGGRRLAKYQFPYTDGQSIDDLGAMPDTFDVECIIFGDSYAWGLSLLMREFQNPRPGWLRHPVHGLRRCKLETYEMLHSHDMRKAAMLRLRFVEHTFSVGSYGAKSPKAKSFKGALSTLMGAYNAFNNAVNKIKAAVNLFNSIKTIIENHYIAFQAIFTDTAVRMNQVFNRGSTVDFPLLVPVNRGGILNADGTLTGNTVPILTNPDDRYYYIPVDQISASVAAAQAVFAAEQYELQGILDGNVTQGSLDGATDTTATAASTGYQSLASVSLAVQSLVLQNQINSARLMADLLVRTLSAVQFNTPQLAAATERDEAVTSAETVSNAVTDDTTDSPGNAALNALVDNPVADVTAESDGALEYYNEILDVKRSIILLQDCFDIGSAQSGIGVKRYVTPRVMSTREIAFANGMMVDRCDEIDLLNPELDSTNWIVSGTEILVPL